MQDNQRNNNEQDTPETSRTGTRDHAISMRSDGLPAATGVDDRRRTQPSEDEIARRAYELFEQRGGEHGHDREDWLEAERQIRAAVEER